MTYHGKNIDGFRVFTCIINGVVITFKSLGYTQRQAARQAREYFKQQATR